MSVVALVIAPSIALNSSDVADYNNKKEVFFIQQKDENSWLYF